MLLMPKCLRRVATLAELPDTGSKQQNSLYTAVPPTFAVQEPFRHQRHTSGAPAANLLDPVT
jgi:hypothetical protein